jgi:fido (protein-threonine AMPylation protein)
METPEPWPQQSSDAFRLALRQNHFNAASQWITRAHAQQPLASADLAQLHFQLLQGLYPTAGQYREGNISPEPAETSSAAATLIPALVDNALDWFDSASFHEIHEIEKTALVLIKLLDLRPFAVGNGITARLFSNFFLLQASYPPAIIVAAQAGQFHAAIAKALQLETQPLVDLLAAAVQRSLKICLGEAEPPDLFPILV